MSVNNVVDMASRAITVTSVVSIHQEATTVIVMKDLNSALMVVCAKVRG